MLQFKIILRRRALNKICDPLIKNLRILEEVEAMIRQALIGRFNERLGSRPVEELIAKPATMAGFFNLN